MSADHKRFVELSWEILEHKFRYYILNEGIISDYEYDVLEKEYDSLADKLCFPKSASDMVGFDTNRESCKEVSNKILRSRKKKK